MADSVTNTVIYNSPQKAVISSAFTIDGTEASVVVGDLSAFTGPNGAALGEWIVEKIIYHAAGMQLTIAFDADTDDVIATISGDGELDFTNNGEFPGFNNPESTGFTGDIIATTLNSDAGDTAHLILFLGKKN